MILAKMIVMFIYSGIAVISDTWISHPPVSANDNIALKMNVMIISLGLYRI